MKLNNVSRFFPALALMAASALAASAQNGVLQFSSLNYSINESASAARITVTRTSGSAGEVTVSFMTIDSGGGTAVADQDYYPVNGTLVFGPGVTSQFFDVPLINDELHEGSETVLVELVDPQPGGASLGNRVSATLTITDNDDCVYTLSPASLILDPNGGLAPVIMVTATDGCQWDATTPAGATWLGILFGTSGQGNGEVVLSYDPNPGASSRTAKLKIAGKTFTVTQLGVPPPDLVPPTVIFSSPAANSRQTNDIITVTGKATDNVAVTLVEFRLENEAEVTDFFPASGTGNWSATFGLIPGANTIRVRAYDAENLPVEATRTVIFVEVSPLTIVTNGEGSITPLRHGQFLDVGRDAMAQAKPARNHFFTHWSGSVESTDNPLTFTMYPGFVLQGNFVFSPFIAIAGSYNGLFSEFENNQLGSSGSLSLKLTDLGAFSAKMLLGGQRISFSGKFALDGLATNIVARPGGSELTILLTLDFAGGEQVTGTISDGDGIWASSVLALRAGFSKANNPAPQAGRYTLIVPGDDTDAVNQPGGDSFGSVIVDASGNAKFSGSLADGTKVSQKAPLSKDGWWPLYVPLYGGGGSILSWVVFLESPEANFTGVFAWIKTDQPGASFYPGGFNVLRELSGSRYRPPTNAMDRVLTFTMGGVEFSAGNLAEPFENNVLLGENNKVSNLGINKLSLSITVSSGLFSGSVTPPGASRSVSFKGALHQKQNYGSGFFLGTDQSGRVKFSE